MGDVLTSAAQWQLQTAVLDYWLAGGGSPSTQVWEWV